MGQLQEAFLLHSRPYRDTSLLCDVWVAGVGVVALVARSARGPKSRFRGLLQPFTKLLVAYRGRGPLYNLNVLELSESIYLPAVNLTAGLYLNELILRSAKHESELPLSLFVAYRHALCQLQQPDIAWSLRVFEKQLLDALGYALPLTTDTNGEKIIADATYSFYPDVGFTRQNHEQVAANIFQGSTILALMQSDKPEQSDVRAAKRLLRQAMSLLIGSRPLNSVAAN